MNTPDLAELRQRLAQARADGVCWACTHQAERLLETRFVAAMLTRRIRQREGADTAAARRAAPDVATPCRNREPDDTACCHDAAAARRRS